MDGAETSGLDFARGRYRDHRDHRSSRYGNDERHVLLRDSMDSVGCALGVFAAWGVRAHSALEPQ